MRLLRCILFLLAACAWVACAWAEGASDRADIEKVLIAFNHPNQRAAVLAKDADLGSLEAAPAGAWTETTAPVFAVNAIRFVAPDVAAVEATSSQYGSVFLKRQVAVLFVMRREAASWKVVLLRPLASWR